MNTTVVSPATWHSRCKWRPSCSPSMTWVGLPRRRCSFLSGPQRSWPKRSRGFRRVTRDGSGSGSRQVHCRWISRSPVSNRPIRSASSNRSYPDWSPCFEEMILDRSRRTRHSLLAGRSPVQVLSAAVSATAATRAARCGAGILMEGMSSPARLAVADSGVRRGRWSGIQGAHPARLVGSFAI